MRPTQRTDLLDQVGRELQRRFTFGGIDEFLSACGIEPQANYSGPNSKWAYAKAALKDVTDSILLEIATELELKPAMIGGTLALPPRNWQAVSKFRVFISHISKDKDKAMRLKVCLSAYAIDGFVAHEDIHPTLEWQVEIERALRNMDAFIAIHTKGFSESIWTQQEIGFAVARDVKIISLKMGEDPTGFISKHQALARGSRTAEQIAKEVDTILTDEARTADKFAAAKKANTTQTLDDEIPF
jgi:TIR domain